ncbi:PAS domain S-box protein [bacterium]
MTSKSTIHCLACSIFKDVFEQLRSEEQMDLSVEYIPSMLHMRPKELDKLLDEKLSSSSESADEVLLLFGDCHPHMQEQLKQYHAHRLGGINCAQILLGRDTYQTLRKEGAFFLLPEWTKRWKEVFQKELGLDEAVAKELMKEMHTQLIYLDFGKTRVPRKILKEISEYTGLPVIVKKVDQDVFRTIFNETLNKVNPKLHNQSSKQDDSAFQAMAFDMVKNMLHQADNPIKLQSDIAVQMRGFTGAHVVILAQFLDEYGESDHEIVYIEPERRSKIAEKEAIHIMLRKARRLKKSRLWTPDLVDPTIGQFLKESDYHLSIAVPLHIGQRKVGALLLLGLPDDNSIDVALNMLDILATILALIFRNALLFKKQESIIEQQIFDLRENEAKYRLLFENMLNAFAYHQIVVDDQGQPVDYVFLEVNDIFEKYTNLSRSDIIGRRVTEVIPGIHNDSANWIGLYGKVALEGQELRFEQHDKVLNKWFSILAYCPQPGFFTTIFEDITERKRSELIIKHSETKFRELFNFAGDSIFIHTLQGRFIEVNDIACQTLGFSRNELLRMTPKDIDASSYALAVDLRIETIRKKGSMVFESEHKTKQGKTFPVEINSRLIDYKGRQAILSVVRDISERKNQEKQLESLLTQKEVLLKEVYHRVKNNFMIISSLLHLQSAKLKDKEAQALFHESRDRVQTMALIHQQLYRSVDLASVDFKSFIEQLMRNLYRSYVSDFSKIQLIQNLEDVYVSVDKAIPCGLIINELITNAFKYAFPNDREGFVKVEFKLLDDDYVKLHICDNGVGLPKGTDITKSESLGLQIVDMLTQQIKGKLIVNVKNGTCITITFSNKLVEE